MASHKKGKKRPSASHKNDARINNIDDRINDALRSDLICEEDYEYDFCFYPYQDEIKGHYSYYFEDDTSELLPSQYLERDVDSYVDCNGDG